MRRTAALRAVALTALAAAAALPLGAATAGPAACGEPAHAAGEWPSYGHDLSNTREQPAEEVIGLDTAVRLEPAFVHQAPGLINNTPIVAGGCVFVASQGEATATGRVVALDADSGKELWGVDIAVGRPAFGGPIVGSPALWRDVLIVPVNKEGAPFLLGLDKATGDERWRVTVDRQPTSGINGSVVVHDGVAMVGFFGKAGPWEKERGGLALYDVANARMTKTFSIPDADFAKGYAGAGIWATPAVDVKTGFAYVGTSNPHNPQLEHDRSNAILKIDVRRASASFGQIVGQYKGIHDTIVPGGQDQPACKTKPDVNYFYNFSATCLAVDVDFGASPNLYTDAGRTLVGSLQKAGVYHVVNTEDMSGVTRTAVGAPCFACNASSSAFSQGKAFVAAGPPGQMVALHGGSGLPAWIAPLAGGLTYNAVSVANGMVWSTDSPGFLNGYDQSTGAQLVKRPMRRDTGASMVQAASSSGIAIARNTLYTAASTFVIAYRPPAAALGPAQR